MDSRHIAPALEAAYPSAPPLLFDAVLVKDAEEMRMRAIFPIMAAWMAPVPRVFLGPRSKAYFEETRLKQWGRPLAEIEAEGVTDEKWEESRQGWLVIAQKLKEKGGPFFMGEKRKLHIRIMTGAGADWFSFLCGYGDSWCVKDVSAVGGRGRRHIYASTWV